MFVKIDICFCSIAVYLMQDVALVHIHLLGFNFTFSYVLTCNFLHVEIES